MTKDEALKIALEALEDVQDMMSTSDWFNERVEVVRQALAEPDTGIDRGAWADVPDATKWVDELRGEDDELPPVKTYCGGKPNYCEIDEKEIYNLWRESESYQVPMTEEGEKLAQHRYRGFKKGYMARREWQGLTDDEIDHIWGITKPDCQDKFDFPRAIEVALKAKNGF